MKIKNLLQKIQEVIKTFNVCWKGGEKTPLKSIQPNRSPNPGWRYGAHCWLENVRNYKNKSPQNNYIFLIPLKSPDFAASIVFLIRVRLPGGAAIISAQSWNFKLKFFLGIPFMKKIGSRGGWVHLLPKNKSKWSKNHNNKFASIIQKTWKWTKF